MKTLSILQPPKFLIISKLDGPKNFLYTGLLLFINQATRIIRPIFFLNYRNIGLEKGGLRTSQS